MLTKLQIDGVDPQSCRRDDLSADVHKGGVKGNARGRFQPGVNERRELEIVPTCPGSRGESIEEDVQAFQTCGASACGLAVKDYGLTLYDLVTAGADLECLG